MTSLLIACADCFLLHSAVKFNAVLCSQGNQVIMHLFFNLKQTETKINMLHAIKCEMRTEPVSKYEFSGKNQKHDVICAHNLYPLDGSRDSIPQMTDSTESPPRLTFSGLL